MFKKKETDNARPSALERSYNRGQMNEIDIPLAHSQIGQPRNRSQSPSSPVKVEEKT